MKYQNRTHKCSKLNKIKMFLCPFEMMNADVTNIHFIKLGDTQPFKKDSSLKKIRTHQLMRYLLIGDVYPMEINVSTYESHHAYFNSDGLAIWL